MSDVIKIRPAMSLESKCLSGIAFRSKAHWGYSTDFMESCREELSVSEWDIENQRHHHFAAESNAKVVGFYAVSRISGDEYELESMFIEPESIGKGIGTTLIEHAKQYVVKNGAKSLLIQSDPNALAFYLAAGGVLVGERESESIPGRYLPEVRIIMDSRDIV